MIASFFMRFSRRAQEHSRAQLSCVWPKSQLTLDLNQPEHVECQREHRGRERTKRLKTPKAAAIAGIAFSLLIIAIFWLLRRSFPADPLESGAWLATNTKTVALALNLVPFAGVAFLWFIGVLRDRLGQQEDRFFATIFFGSALLFLAMLFVAAAGIGAVILVAASAESRARFAKT
jgi:hypothetical protein